MKNKLFKLITIVLLVNLTSNSIAGNDNELKFNVNKSLAPFHLTKARGGSDDGIKGKLMVSANVGFNALRVSLLARYIAEENTYTPVITSSKQTPIICLGADYGLGKKFSAGIAFGYQTVTLTGDAYNNGIEIVDKWTRIQIALRGDYYIVAKDNISLYTGLKVGYNMFSMKTTYPGSIAYPQATYISDVRAHVVPSVIATQAHFGFSYYFNGMIGLNTEVGLAYGGPYYFAAGLTFKF